MSSQGLPELPRLTDYVAHYAATDPEREACVFEDQRWTYAELERRVDACARAMLSAGVNKGDRVAMLSTPRPEYLVVLMAANRIGALWFGLNPVYQETEHAVLLEDAAPRLLFAFAASRGRSHGESLVHLMDRFPGIERLVTFDDPLAGRAQPYSDFLTGGLTVSADAVAQADPEPSGEDVALIVYTSGSTGRPKGAMLTNRGLVLGGINQFDIWPVRPLRAICNLPTNHVGCNGDIVGYVLPAGGTLVFHERFDADLVADTIEAERISWIIGVPLMYQDILKAQDNRARDLSSLQVIYFAGAAMPRPMIARLRAICPGIYTTWGMTETTTGATYSAPNDGDDILATTVGRPMPMLELGIMDGDGGLLSPGEAGELVVRGPTVTPGYFRRPEATREAFDAAGWFHTGDVATVGEDGRLRIVGRMKEMFKSGGYNVYPREIERAIEEHPDVEVASVVPAPDPRFQEIGIAFVLPVRGRTLTPDQLERHTRGKLAGYKVPKLFVVRDSLPMVEIGKVDRVNLKAEAANLWRPD